MRQVRTVWVVSMWLAGTWNGLPYGFYSYLQALDFAEVA